MRKIRLKVKAHAKLHWGYSEKETEGILISKFDVAKDLYGSFIPDDSKEV